MVVLAGGIFLSVQSFLVLFDDFVAKLNVTDCTLSYSSDIFAPTLFSKVNAKYRFIFFGAKCPCQPKNTRVNSNPPSTRDTQIHPCQFWKKVPVQISHCPCQFWKKVGLTRGKSVTREKKNTVNYTYNISSLFKF